MSRVGKNPVKILSGVKVALTGGKVLVDGPKGKLSRALPEGVVVKVQGDQVVVSRDETNLEASSRQGLIRTLIHNMVHGVHTGFSKELQINGVGYRVAVKGQTVSLSLGFSHAIDYDLPTGVTAAAKGTSLVLTSADRELLGDTAAKIRAFRPPEPYQGKGVKYLEERIVRKQGKAAGAK